MKLILSMPLVAALVMAGDGLAPRSGPSEYPAHASAGQLTVAAVAVSADQAKRILGARIDQAGYLVFEVALYPEPGSGSSVSLGDFALRLGADGSTMRAAEPDVIAAATIPYQDLGQHEPLGSTKVVAEASASHGAGSVGPSGGIASTQGIGVGDYPDVPPPPPNAGAKAAARDRLKQALTSKQLPTGLITRPVAGYLYFPKPSGHGRKDGFQLSWLGENGQARMTVPPAK
jgi:hypothetical protein